MEQQQHGIYIRLSTATKTSGYGSKAESDGDHKPIGCIAHQPLLTIIQSYPLPRSEFADDGYTGTNFHRPQFTQMMEKERARRDRSDSAAIFPSRDYIETGNSERTFACGASDSFSSTIIMTVMITRQ